MKYIIKFWDFKRHELSTMELEGETARDNVLSYLKRYRWVKKNGVWHSPKENG